MFIVEPNWATQQVFSSDTELIFNPTQAQFDTIDGQSADDDDPQQSLADPIINLRISYNSLFELAWCLPAEELENYVDLFSLSHLN